MTELRIFPHQDHWHVQWLADGEQEDVYADGCDGYATHAAAVAARSELQERYDHLGVRGCASANRAVRAGLAVPTACP